MLTSSIKQTIHIDSKMVPGKNMYQKRDIAVQVDAFAKNAPNRVSMAFHQSVIELPTNIALTIWYLDFLREVMVMLVKKNRRYQKVFIENPASYKTKFNDVENSDIKFSLGLKIDSLIFKISELAQNSPDKSLDEIIFDEQMTLVAENSE